MITVKPYRERPTDQQRVIDMAYNFEMDSIKSNSSADNPWIAIMATWEDGAEMIEALNVAVELYYGVV